VLLNSIAFFSLGSARAALPKENWLAMGSVPLVNLMVLIADFASYVYGTSQVRS